jgi:hypothetical protein
MFSQRLVLFQIKIIVDIIRIQTFKGIRGGNINLVPTSSENHFTAGCFTDYKISTEPNGGAR